MCATVWASHFHVSHFNLICVWSKCVPALVIGFCPVFTGGHLKGSSPAMMFKELLNGDKLYEARDKVLKVPVSFLMEIASFFYFLLNQQGDIEQFITDNIHLCLSEMCHFPYSVIKFLYMLFGYLHCYKNLHNLSWNRENVEATSNKSKQTCTLVTVDSTLLSLTFHYFPTERLMTQDVNVISSHCTCIWD